MDVRDGCQRWMLEINVRIGCQKWMLNMDVSDGCQKWMLEMNVSDKCQRLMLAMICQRLMLAVICAIIFLHAHTHTHTHTHTHHHKTCRWRPCWGVGWSTTGTGSHSWGLCWGGRPGRVTYHPRSGCGRRTHTLQIKYTTLYTLYTLNTPCR